MRHEPKQAVEAWRRYVSIGAIDAEKLAPTIARAWERCHEARANPLRMRAEMLSRYDTERTRAKNAALISAASPYVHALSRAAGPERHAVMLGDARAIVLDVMGDHASVYGPESVPGPGALLSEACAGANGIATPLAERSYVQLTGAEHFIGGFHAFTCQGVPIAGSSGASVGCLSASVRSPGTAARLRHILGMAAKGIAAELRAVSLRESVAAITGAGKPEDKALLLARLYQEVVQAHVDGRFQVELSSFELGSMGDASQLLIDAEAAIDRFDRLSRAWRLVAEADPSGARDVPTRELLDDLITLLQPCRRAVSPGEALPPAATA
jgi:sigma-54 dependent transcriptional regulator, acetoin dehydrogenase operon transcriptional activator AcoR